MLQIKTKADTGFGNGRITRDLYKSSFNEIAKRKQECRGLSHEWVRQWTLGGKKITFKKLEMKRKVERVGHIVEGRYV